MPTSLAHPVVARCADALSPVGRGEPAEWVIAPRASPPALPRGSGIRARIPRPFAGAAEDPRARSRVPGSGNLRLTPKGGEPLLFPKAPRGPRAAMYLNEGRSRWGRAAIGRPRRTWRREIHRREASPRYTGRTAAALRGQRRR